MPKEDDDPLTLAIRPPKNETPEQKVIRLQAEADALKQSQLIDLQLRAERAQLKKENEKTHKVLLLGQAESGKTTVIKNFQLSFVPNAFRQQQKSWKALVQLNLVRSILVICQALTDDLNEQDLDIDNFLSLDPSVSPNYSVKKAESLLDTSQGPKRSSYPYPGTPDSELGPIPEITNVHRALKMRLSPLYHVQTVLVEYLACQFDDPSLLAAVHQFKEETETLPDFVVRSNTSLNGFMGKSLRGRESYEGTYVRLDIQEVDAVLMACRQDMITVWKDPVVREILHRRDIRLEEGPGTLAVILSSNSRLLFRILNVLESLRFVSHPQFHASSIMLNLHALNDSFLHEINRITEADYTPSQEDVLRARLRTVGVQEYSFHLETGPDKGREWRVFDCGGARNQRHSWPFFDDCHLIFLAPISCFDQVLAEDRRVNRLEDSLQLWKAVCSSKLLQKSEIILFLNKCDILQAKLTSGIKFSDWVPNFDGQNSLDGVTKYLKGKFRAIQKAHSPVSRVFYCHLTAVTDARSTSKILSSVQELVARAQLQNVSLL
ncbi:hypothetical protein FRB91_001617 [Serendipita sp. 411]|nr:hypothetical protein FRC18_007466 [Serendipita sp. 400]KAG8855893.1 hypothetical protein FRB91_001617 [Serendipita sp. 411]